MRSCCVVLILAIAGNLVSADDVAFIENVRSFAGDSRIVSGWPAEEGQHPHQVSLRMINPAGNVNGCGGSVVHNEWILTAAHCTASRVTFVVRIGTVNLTRPGYIVEATEFYNHPDYDGTRPSVVQPHDISLLKLPILVPYSANIQPIRLQRSSDIGKNYGGVTMVASGWGITWTGGASAEHMNWVYLLGESYESCRAAYLYSPIIVPSTICASAYNVTSQSTCSGDSGGPLSIIDDDGKQTLVGVTSFVSGSGCHTAVPAGFIQPAYYHDWLREVSGIDFDWTL